MTVEPQYDLFQTVLTVLPVLLLVAWFLWIRPRDERMAQELRDLNARLDAAHESLDDRCEHYVSTACHHANDDDNDALHAECRLQCKWCPRRCGCECHQEGFVHLLDKPEYDTVEQQP